MAENFKTVDIDATKRRLLVEVVAGRGDFAMSETDIIVNPPMTPQEYDKILRRIGTESVLGKAITQEVSFSTQIGDERPTVFTIDGAPSEAHRWYGVELAKELVTIRGIGAAMVTTMINEETRQELVIENSMPATEGISVALVH